LGTGYSVHHRIVSAVTKVDFIKNRVPYMVLRGRLSNSIVLNVHTKSEQKMMIKKKIFMRN